MDCDGVVLWAADTRAVSIATLLMTSLGAARSSSPWHTREGAVFSSFADGDPGAGGHGQGGARQGHPRASAKGWDRGLQAGAESSEVLKAAWMLLSLLSAILAERSRGSPGPSARAAVEEGVAALVPAIPE